MPGGGARNGDIRHVTYATPLDLAVSRIAARQYGVISLSQLKALGLSPDATRSRVAAGRLHRLHRGVYAVGHTVLSNEARWLAAVLAYGGRAVLSHRSAAALWGLLRGSAQKIDVTLARGRGRSRQKITAHVVRNLVTADVTSVRAIPCTTVPRTLLDLADAVDRRALERAQDRAEVMGVFDRNALEDVLGRARGRRGAAILQKILDEYEAGAGLTESELEERFLALCLDAGIRRPRVNEWIVLDGGAVRADLLWPEQALIVETDGRLVKQLTRQPNEVARTVASLLKAGPAK